MAYWWISDQKYIYFFVLMGVEHAFYVINSGSWNVPQKMIVQGAGAAVQDFGMHQSINIIGEQPVRRTRAGSTDPDERIWTIRRKFIRKVGRCDRLGKNLSASVDIPTGVMFVMGAWGVMGACGRGENLTWYLVLHQ